MENSNVFPVFDFVLKQIFKRLLFISTQETAYDTCVCDKKQVVLSGGMAASKRNCLESSFLYHGEGFPSRADIICYPGTPKGVSGGILLFYLLDRNIFPGSHMNFL